MPSRNPELHGNAPDKSDVALLIIDVINDLDFPEGEALLEHALPMARQIAALKRRAKEAGIPVIYVNDNFGRWQSNFNNQVDHVIQDFLQRALCNSRKPREFLVAESAEPFGNVARRRPRGVGQLFAELEFPFDFVALEKTVYVTLHVTRQAPRRDITKVAPSSHAAE